MELLQEPSDYDEMNDDEKGLLIMMNTDNAPPRSNKPSRDWNDKAIVECLQLSLTTEAHVKEWKAPNPMYDASQKWIPARLEIPTWLTHGGEDTKTASQRSNEEVAAT